MCLLGLLGTKLRNRICILIFSLRSLFPRFFLSWRDSPLVVVGLLIHEDFCDV